MINLMISGSGLKNKIVEAVALRRAVVFNVIGAEAIDATPEKYCLQSESPSEMAEQIMDCLQNTHSDPD